MLVDTQGFVLKVYVHAANESDTVGGQALLERLNEQFPRLCHLWTDSGYQSTFQNWVQSTLGWTVECVKRPHKLTGEYAALVKDFLGENEFERLHGSGFKLLPRRWVVERTFAWLGHQRRLSKDCELLPQTTEAWIYLASARILWKRFVSYSVS